MMDISRRRFLQTTGAVAGSSLLPSIVRAEDGKRMTVRMPSQFKSLDPGYMFGSTEMAVQFGCLPILANYNPGGGRSWRPSYYVTSIEYADDLNIKFSLRPGLEWSNGYGEVTAEDVRYSFERMKESEWNVKYDSVDSVEVIDTLNGVIKLKYPFAPIWNTTLCNGTGIIVCKNAVEEMGGRFDTELPATCGPYLFTNFISEQSWELHRNPEWEGPKPDLDEIKFVVIREEKTSELGVEAGEIDLTRISVESAPRYRESPPPDASFVELQGNGWCWIGMNVDNPKLQDVRVRRAIQHAVDVDTILQAAWSGASPRARGIVPRGQIGYRTETKFEKPDLDRARALLAEAGVSNLSLTFKTSNQRDYVTVGEVVQANLAEIGIQLEVTPLETGTFWIQGIEAEGEQWKDLELWVIEYADSPDPSQATQWYVGEQVGVWNWERFRDQEFDDLHVEAMQEADEQKRHQMYLRMQEIMEDTGAYIWLHHRPAHWLHANHIEPSIWTGSLIDVAGTKWVG